MIWIPTKIVEATNLTDLGILDCTHFCFAGDKKIVTIHGRNIGDQTGGCVRTMDLEANTFTPLSAGSA